MSDIQKLEIGNSNLKTYTWLRVSSFLSIVIVTVLLTILVPSPSKAQSPTLKTSTSSGTPSEVIDKLKQIKILKEKIATKVAEIREKDKKALLGIIKKTQQSTITITNNLGDRTISFSDDSIFYTLSKEEKSQTSAKKIKEGDIISAYGYLTEENNSFLAKFIYVQTPISHIVGKIADKDTKNYTITVKEKKGNIIVDIEKYTSSYAYNRDKASLTKIGFSKLNLGDVVHIIGTPHEKEEERIHALKILTLAFPALTTPTSTELDTSSASPTSGLEQ